MPDNFRKFDNSKSLGFQRRGKDEERPNRSKGIQCHECEGYGHIKAECPTFLKKQKKGMVVTWSDDDSEDEGEDVTANVEGNSSDEEMTDEDSRYLQTHVHKMEGVVCNM